MLDIYYIPELPWQEKIHFKKEASDKSAMGSGITVVYILIWVNFN
jgi:hypothetical protein